MMKRTLYSALPATLLLTLMVVWCAPLIAQDTAATQTADAGFSTEQLEQMVAPIALYPDSLLMQVLMASTYPLEIVEAQRWMGKNPGLDSSALDEALKGEDWDASVKSLCSLPDVLENMSDNLDWTQDLGDAFLGQQEDLLDTVQTMRGKAFDAGNLETTEQQVVTVEKEKIIVIESPSPEIVYVPTYSPTVVYGVGWGYPRYFYPPLYAPYPPGYGFVAFGVGVAVGAAIWGGCRWGWGRSSVNINVNRYNNFNRNTNINHNRTNIKGGSGGQAGWNHNPSHRGGVSYKNNNVASQYGGSGKNNRVSTQEARGKSGANAGNRSANQASNRAQGAGASNRASTANRQQGAGASNRSGASSYNRTGNRSGSSAYSGASKPQYDRAASSRGSMSRGTSSYSGARSGGTRSRGGRSR